MQSKYITEHDIEIKKMETKYEDIHKSSTFKKINSGLEETLVEEKKKINIFVKNGGTKNLLPQYILIH